MWCLHAVGGQCGYVHWAQVVGAVLACGYGVDLAVCEGGGLMLMTGVWWSSWSVRVCRSAAARKRW